jgi:hypothetical protein
MSSNSYKSIFNKEKKDVGVGKDEFLARRKFFLEMAQNENKNAKKSFSPSHVTNRYTSNLKPEPKFRPIKSTSSAAFSKDPSSTTKTTNKTNSTKSPSLRPTITKLTETPNTLTGSAGFSAPKSNSLKNILSQVGRNNQFVSNDEFRSRRKAFEDAQTNDITQLLPRPLTPSGYCYYGRSSPLLGVTSSRPWSPASERPWSPAYERHGSPTPSFDSERSFGASEVRLPWERPTQNKKTTATPAKEEKKVFTTPAVPGSPALSATPITSDEPMAIPITNDIVITPPPQEKSNEDLLNEKLKMWYSKVDEEIEKEQTAEVAKVEE